MKSLLLSMLTVSVLLSACAGGAPATRSDRDMSLAMPSPAAFGPSETRQVRTAQFDVTEVRISVPEQLKVSEANVFYPMADIVWRGEPRGDRHAQVKAIFSDAVARGTQGMTSGRRVIVDLEVTRFHSVTEKTRYTVGGTHSLHFTMTVTDAVTGQVLDGPRPVIADTKAAGGANAVAEDQIGRTQRVVVVDRLAEVIRRELSAPVVDPLLISQALSQPATLAN